LICSRVGVVTIMTTLIRMIQSSNPSRGKRYVASSLYHCGPSTAVKQLGCKVYHSPPFGGKVKNKCSYTSILLYTSMTWTGAIAFSPLLLLIWSTFHTTVGNILYMTQTIQKHHKRTLLVQMNIFLMHAHHLPWLIRCDCSVHVSCSSSDNTGTLFAALPPQVQIIFFYVLGHDKSTSLYINASNNVSSILHQKKTSIPWFKKQNIYIKM
jgi:hypothetical protein